MDCFDTYTDRSGGVMWLKGVLTPETVSARGLRGFSGAEFEFPTCPAFSRGVAEAARKGCFGFTLPGEAYRERVCWWMRHVRGFDAAGEWIVPTHGTIFALATAIRLLTHPGDSIAVLTPGYNRYIQAAARLGRGTVRVPLREEQGRYSVDLAALERACADPAVRLLALCNPQNPTGSIWHPELLREIRRITGARGVAVFSDEIFAEVVLDGTRVPSWAEIAGDDPLGITCTGMGKVFSLTGVNHANVLIPNPALREAYIRQRNADHYGSLDPMVHAGLLSAYTEEGAAWVRGLCGHVREMDGLLARALSDRLPGVRITPPEATYVLWADFTPCGLDRETLLEKLTPLLGDWGEEYDGPALAMRYATAVPRGELLRAADPVFDESKGVSTCL